MTDLVAADFAIRQTHARFADAVWRQDTTEFAACFAAEGVWKIAGQEFVGREAIAAGADALVGRCTRVHLIIGQSILRETAEGIQGRHPMTELAWMPDGDQFITVGVYHDHYREEGGDWLFARRHWAFKYRGPIDLSAGLIDTPDYGAFPAGPTPDEDTFVRRA